MADDTPGTAETKAERPVREASDAEFIQASKAQAGILVEAVERDMTTLAEKVNDDGNRLAKLETQTQVLAEAVIAITKTDETLAPAISAVKAEMHGPRSTERKPDASQLATLDVAGLKDIARKLRETDPATAAHEPVTAAPQVDRSKKSS